jgi:hypothetical protein
MSWWKRIFGIEPTQEVVKEKAPKADAKELDDFTVEFYPRTGKYYAVHRGRYMQRDQDTGIVGFPSVGDLYYATARRTEQEAWELVDLYVEQRYKKCVKVITRSKVDGGPTNASVQDR